ncbi:MAG: DNRLRE domain-containing protein [Anaerolineae bacterium]|nr:DNRLRE domain-containing protein [Anaerolineae bacterium]
MASQRWRYSSWGGPVLLILLAALLVGTGGVEAWHPLDEDPQPTVYFSPNPVEVGWGLTKDVDIVVENVVGLYAIELRMSFPNTLVQVIDADPTVPGVQIQPGNVFDGFDTYVIQNNVDNSTGVIEYIISITGSEVGFTGDAVIATISLDPLALGDAVMSFVEVVLCERDGTSIPVVLGDGQADVDVVSETSTPTFTPGGGTPESSPTTTATLGPTATTVPPAEVFVSPADQQLPLGDTAVVQVRIEDVWDLYGFDIRLDFNGALLDVEDADASTPQVEVYMGDVFDGFSYQVLENEVSDDGIFGQVHFVAYINSGELLGFCGDGTLFWLVFHGMAPGLSNLTLSEVTLVDHGGTTISRDLTHGQIEVLSTGDTSTPTPTSTLTLTATPTPSPTGSATITLTPTPTGSETVPPGATETATPSPTPTGALSTPTPVCDEHIENGGFENVVGGEAAPWVRTGSTSYTTVEKHTGSYSAWLGGYNNGADGLYQEVTIPSLSGPGEEVTQVTLSYWWGMMTEEVTHPYDFMYIRIRDTQGNLLQDLETLSDGSASGTWQHSEFDLSAYKGQTIRICFEVETDGSNVTSFFVDDVSLIICQILQPTATATATPSPTISPTPTETGLPTATPTITPTPIVRTFQYKAGEYEGCYDSFLAAWDPTANYGHQGALSIRTAGVKRPVIYFDVSEIPAGVTIMDARLWLYTSHYKSHAQDMTVSVYGLKRPWSEMEVTWNQASSGVAWTQGGADDTLDDRDASPSGSELVSEMNAWYGFDVTSLVQAWVDGTRPNYGMLLLATGNTVEMSFWSSEYSIENLRPKLVVQYTYGSVNTPVPTSPQETVTPGASATPTMTATPGGSELILQQGYLGYSGVRDTYISQWQPTTNYGGNVTMIVRQGDIRSSLVWFDLSSVPAGATILEARLELYAVSRSNAGALTIDVYQVLRPWAEGQATWEQATSSTAWGLPGCNDPGTDLAGTPVATTIVDTIDSWHRWDITSLVQGWVNNPGTNRGVILKGRGPTSVEYSYAASEYWWAQELSPRLVIRYTTS